MNNLSVEEESKIVSVFHTTEQYIHNYVQANMGYYLYILECTLCPVSAPMPD